MSRLQTAPVEPWVGSDASESARPRTQRQQRRQYFIDPEFQLRLLGEVFFVLLVGAILALVNFHVVETVVYGAGDPIAQFPPMQRVLLWAYAVVSVVITVTLIVSIAIYYSHRIAGPAFKLTRSLEDISKGDLRLHIRLRKKDHLKKVAAAVNEATGSWARSVFELRAAVQQLREDSSGIELDALAERLDSIETILDHYQVDAPTSER